MEPKPTVDKYALRFLLFIFCCVFSDTVQFIVEPIAIKSEDAIAYVHDLLFILTLPMAFFLFFLGWILINRFYKKRSVANKATLSQMTEHDRHKAQGFLIIMLIFGLCISSVCLYFGISQKTVVTSDYTVKDYSITGELKEEYKPEDLRFVKIFPEVYYDGRSGFDSIYAVIELYINENECFRFTSDDFESFQDMIELKNAIKANDKKIYISDKAENEPDSDTLIEEDIETIEKFYLEYEKIK